MSTDLTPERAVERDALRAKIEASERRMAERTLADSAAEAAGAATEYVKQNPLTVLAGAIAVGLVIGAASKPGRRAAKSAATGAASAVGGAVGGAASSAAKGVGTAAKKRGSAFGGLIADALIAYGLKIIDDALDGSRDQPEDTRTSGASATTKARGLRREASLATGKASDRAGRVVRELTDRIIN